MNEEELINKLASRAKLETAPSIDVADNVIAALKNREEEDNGSYAPLAWVAAVSAAIAVPVAIFALMAWDALNTYLLTTIGKIPWGIL